MWPFNKKDSFDLDALEKELNTGGSNSNHVNNNNVIPEDDFDTPKTTKEDRLNMAMSISNTDDTILPPSSHEPSNYPAYNHDNNHFSNNSQNMSQSQQGNIHKIDVMEKQIEILSSKIDLLKANIDSMNSKLISIEQKLDKKLNSW